MVFILRPLHYSTENVSQHKRHPSSYREEFQQDLHITPPPAPFLLAILFSYFIKITALGDITLEVKSG